MILALVQAYVDSVFVVFIDSFVQELGRQNGLSRSRSSDNQNDSSFGETADYQLVQSWNSRRNASRQIRLTLEHEDMK